MESLEMLCEMLTDVKFKFFYKHQTPKIYDDVTKVFNLHKEANLDEKIGSLEKHLENYQCFCFFANCCV